MYRIIFSLCFFAACFLISPQQSIAQVSNCDQEMKEATDLYALGRFDETITLIDQCLDKQGVADEQRRAAYRLKGLSYIGKGLEGDAKASVRRLLALVPDYQPDPVLDPPDFVSMVDEVKSEMEGSGQPSPATTSEPRVIRSNDVGPDREGFTFLLSIGVGFQAAEGESESGLGGLNLGLGGFINDNLAVLGRISGTTVSEEQSGIEASLISGTLGLTLQYWLNDRVFLEAGPGLGFARAEISIAGLGSDTADETGFGLILGGGFVVFNKKRNNIHIGVEYAPVFLDSVDINNIGITVAYQLL